MPSVTNRNLSSSLSSSYYCYYYSASSADHIFRQSETTGDQHVKIMNAPSSVFIYRIEIRGGNKGVRGGEGVR